LELAALPGGWWNKETFGQTWIVADIVETDFRIPFAVLVMNDVESRRNSLEVVPICELLFAHESFAGTAHFEPCKLLAGMAASGEKFYPKS